MTNPDNILKSRGITLSTKACLVKAMFFPVVMYRCESQTIKKAEHRRIDASELWCWIRLLRVYCIARRLNQSNTLNNHSLIIISAVAEIPILWPPDVKSRLSRKTEDKRRRGWKRIRWLDRITDLMEKNSSNL